jgi:hypothetical protein
VRTLGDIKVGCVIKDNIQPNRNYSEVSFLWRERKHWRGTCPSYIIARVIPQSSFTDMSKLFKRAIEITSSCSVVA